MCDGRSRTREERSGPCRNSRGRMSVSPVVRAGCHGNPVQIASGRTVGSSGRGFLGPYRGGPKGADQGITVEDTLRLPDPGRFPIGSYCHGEREDEESAGC